MPKLQLFVRKKFKAGNAVEMTHVSCKEGKFVDLAHGGDECVLDADVHTFTGQSVMEVT